MTTAAVTADRDVILIHNGLSAATVQLNSHNKAINAGPRTSNAWWSNAAVMSPRSRLAPARVAPHPGQSRPVRALTGQLGNDIPDL